MIPSGKIASLGQSQKWVGPGLTTHIYSKRSVTTIFCYIYVAPVFFKDSSPSVRSGRIYLSLRLTVPDVGEMVIRRPVFFAVKITIKAPSTLYWKILKMSL